MLKLVILIIEKVIKVIINMNIRVVDIIMKKEVKTKSE